MSTQRTIATVRHVYSMLLLPLCEQHYCVNKGNKGKDRPWCYASLATLVVL